MKLLFDLSATQPDKKIINHGGSEYTKALFIKLIEFCPASVSVFYNQELDLEKEILELVQKHSLDVLEKVDTEAICNYISEHGINVFYTALPKREYIPLIKMQSTSFKVIITIHGLRTLEIPSDKFEWYYCQSFKAKIKFIYKQLFPVIYKNHILKQFRMYLDASKLITVSNHSKYSLLTFFPELSVEKILVFYSPLIQYTNNDNSLDDLTGTLSLLPQKYFLLLSGSIWTKNSFRAIRAFDKLITSNPLCKEYKMLITGFNGPSFKVKNNENFIFKDYLNRNSLEKLIKNALGLVYPTLNEGFGYPPLEALKYGVPVLASGIGPIPEVCGTAAYYFNPFSEAEIRNKLYFAICESGMFSKTNLETRHNRYNMIRERQENDLTKLINVLIK